MVSTRHPPWLVHSNRRTQRQGSPNDSTRCPLDMGTKFASPGGSPVARVACQRAPGSDSPSGTRWMAVESISAGRSFMYVRVERPIVPPVPRIMAGTSDLGATLETSLTGLQGLLAGVKDVASAQSALPRLRETQSALDRIGSTSGLSPDARKAMAGYVAAWLPTLTPYIVRLLGDTAIGPVLRPVLEALRTRLEAMAKA